MVNFVPVERERHAGKGWRPPTDYAFAATSSAIPLLIVECAKAAVVMPIAFIEKSGRYQPVAVMSPVQGRNLFIGPGGQWLGGYMPALLRGYPFSLLRAEGGEKTILCIDEDSGLIVDADEDGPNSSTRMAARRRRQKRPLISCNRSSKTAFAPIWASPRLPRPASLCRGP